MIDLTLILNSFCSCFSVLLLVPKNPNIGDLTLEYVQWLDCHLPLACTIPHAYNPQWGNASTSPSYVSGPLLWNYTPHLPCSSFLHEKHSISIWWVKSSNNFIHFMKITHLSFILQITSTFSSWNTIKCFFSRTVINSKVSFRKETKIVCSTPYVDSCSKYPKAKYCRNKDCRNDELWIVKPRERK